MNDGWRRFRALDAWVKLVGTPIRDLTDMTRLNSLLLVCSALVACSPTVRVEAPKEPIEINLNVRIQHEIRIQVDRELEPLFDKDSELF